MKKYHNPYCTSQASQHAIWEMLIYRDFEGFLSQNWRLVENDYCLDGFYGIDFRKSEDHSQWKLTYPTLELYKQAWLDDSTKFKETRFAVCPREALYLHSKLENWDFRGDKAIVQKVFDGVLPVVDGYPIELKWRSIFLLQNHNDAWKVNGFVGYMSL